MNPKMIIKITVDILMTIFLFLLMSYYITGNRPHEWIGAGMLILVLFHIILNWTWIRSLRRGTYNVHRVFRAAINSLLFLCMAGLMYSGVILSRHVFAFLPIAGGTGMARSLHHVCAYWGFVLLSIHIGQHWSMILGMARKALNKSVRRFYILRAAAALIAGYGVYAFITRQFPQYMFNRIQFSFFDYDEPVIFFFFDYLSIMALFVFLGHYMTRLTQKRQERKLPPAATLDAEPPR